MLLPAGVLFGAFLAMLSVAQEGDHRSMLIMMATGLAILVCVWLVQRQYLGILIMGAQGFDSLRDRVARLDWIHRREIVEYERTRIGGPDTDPPDGSPS